MGLCPLGYKEVDVLLLPPGRAYNMLLSDHLITDYLLRSVPAKEKWFQSNHPYKP